MLQINIGTPESGPRLTNISLTQKPLITFEGNAKEVGKLEKHNGPLLELR